MSMLDGLFKNPVVKAALLKQLKNFMVKHKITIIVLTQDKNNEIDFKPYFEEMKIVPKKDFDNLIKDLTNESIGH